MSLPTPSSNPRGIVRSQLADDPDMAELIALFVSELPQRMETLRRCWADRDLDMLTRLAHQLKGAGGGYGFDQLGAIAGQLEDSLRTATHGSAEGALDRARETLTELLELCSRVRA